MPETNATGSEPSVSAKFDTDLIKTGYYKKDGKKNSIYKSVYVTVTPASKANDVTFEFKNNGTGQATKKIIKKTPSGNSTIFELGVGGWNESNDANGDVDLNAVYPDGSGGKQTLATAKVSIVIPKTQKHTIAESDNAIENTASQISPNAVVKTTLSSKATIQILDQFGAILDSVYDKGSVVEEFYPEEHTGNGGAPPSGKQPIASQTNQLLDGKVTDPVELYFEVALTFEMSEHELEEWQSGTYFIPEPSSGDNVFQFQDIPDIDGYGFDATQHITVWGWEVTPNFKRVQRATNGSYSSKPFNFSDTAE